MKYLIALYRILIKIGIIQLLLSSCSNDNTLQVEHTFKSAINVEQNITAFDKVQFNEFEDLSLGFFKGNIWIKLEVTNGDSYNSYMVINDDKINRNYDFYKLDTLDNAFKLTSSVIDKTLKDSRTFNFQNPNFKIDLAPNENATYLIVTTSDGRTVDATPKLISMGNYSGIVYENTIWSIIFLGVISSLILINVYQRNIHKKRIYTYYIFYMFCTLMMYIGLEGHLFNFKLKFIIIDHFIFVSIRIWVLSLILYTLNFLEIKQVAPKFYKYSRGLLFIILGLTTCYQFIFYYSSIGYLHYFENSLSFLWLLLIFVIIVISAKKRKLELKYYLIPLFFFVLFTTIGLLDGHYQIFPGSPYIYIKLGTIIEFIGFTYFMGILIKEKLNRTDILEKELINTSEELKEKDKLLTVNQGIEKTDLISIFKLLENSLSSEDDWKEFKAKFKELNPNFISLLLSSHPNLSKSEIRLLTLIQIGYSQKEIATVLNIAPDSVKKAKSRVRKRLNLPKTLLLKEYLEQLE